MSTLTRTQERVITAADDIFGRRADETDAAFLARQLVQATLPHRSPGNVPIWKRTNGNLTLAIQPGYDIKTGKSLGYPFGTIPRLLLFWMNTEALRTDSRKLNLGNNLSQFMRQLDLDPHRGGVRSDAHRLKRQMARLFNAIISFEGDIEKDGYHGTARHNMVVASKTMLWWTPRNPHQSDILESWIELGDDFFKAITASPVPVDMRALRALKNSALALDLYSWLTYTAFRSNQNNQPRFVLWKSLHAQLGAEYSRIDNFQQACRKALHKIELIYPDLVLGDRRGGIEVLPSSLPAILPRR